MSEKEISHNPATDSQSLTRLGAAVLGTDDGIVSTSAVLMGVVGA